MKATFKVLKGLEEVWFNSINKSEDGKNMLNVRFSVRERFQFAEFSWGYDIGSFCRYSKDIEFYKERIIFSPYYHLNRGE